MSNKKHIIRFNDWNLFKENLLKCKDLYNTEEELCTLMNINYSFYCKIIESSIRSWQDSPSTSLFNAISKTKLSIPNKGVKIFNSYIEQIRFMVLLDNNSILSSMNFARARNKNNENIVIKGHKLLIYRSNDSTFTENKVNEILQILFIYRFIQHIKLKKHLVKVPKYIYRGIRLSDLYSIPIIKKLCNNISLPSEATWLERHAKRTDVIIDYLKNNGLNSIAHRHLLSFTSSKVIAKYFTKGEGIIVVLNTADTDLFTSEIQDERFQERDFVSNKKEKEYIVNVSNKKIFVSDIIINDLDYLTFNQSPLAVSLFDHDDKTAFYEINDIKIEAYYAWSSNTTGSMQYRNLNTKNSWGLSSREFSSQFGFNPRIPENDLDKVKNFKIVLKK